MLVSPTTCSSWGGGPTFSGGGWLLPRRGAAPSSPSCPKVPPEKVGEREDMERGVRRLAPPKLAGERGRLDQVARRHAACPERSNSLSQKRAPRVGKAGSGRVSQSRSAHSARTHRHDLGLRDRQTPSPGSGGEVGGAHTCFQHQRPRTALPLCGPQLWVPFPSTLPQGLECPPQHKSGIFIPPPPPHPAPFSLNVEAGMQSEGNNSSPFL